MKDWKRIVVKVGTSTICRDNGTLNLRRMDQIARVLSDLCHKGHEIILVTSGATIAGMQRVGMHTRPSETDAKQAVAAIGQCELMSVYDRCFMDYGMVTAQILLTKEVTEEPSSRANAMATFEQLLKMNVLPIVNENDSVSTYEFHYGDNDTLSAVVSELVHADILIILSDIDGFYDQDPTHNPNAKLIPVVESITDEIKEMATGAHTDKGTGGFITKLNAAEIASRAGIDTIITSGENPSILYDLLDGQSCGTRFCARKK